jgi:hypothetical protein
MERPLAECSGNRWLIIGSIWGPCARLPFAPADGTGPTNRPESTHDGSVVLTIDNFRRRWWDRDRTYRRD